MSSVHVFGTVCGVEQLSIEDVVGTIRVGGPRSVDAAAEFARLRASGTSYHVIARAFNTWRVPTARGGRWWPSTVARHFDDRTRMAYNARMRARRAQERER